jgi:uncharacterized membrane protein YgaE (UPF0421/DUF939 family)
MISNINLKNLLILAGGIFSIYVIFNIFDIYKPDPAKKEYEKKIEELERQVQELKVQTLVLEGEYKRITTLPEKNQIITIKTKYEKDSIFIRYAPVSVSDSIIRAKLNSIR